jgi:hypothetical protein
MTDTPTNAARCCINALDTIDHAKRKMYTDFNRPNRKQYRRIELMRYFLITYGYAERREEEREMAIANVDLALGSLFNSFKPNTPKP